MSLVTITFIFAATVLICAAVRVVVTPSPVQAAFSLIVAFFSAATLMVLLGAEFLAMILVIVYVGAVAILFLFVVMMLDPPQAAVASRLWRARSWALVVALLLGVELVLAILSQKQSAKWPSFVNADADLSNTRAIGAVLYTDYIAAFQVAGLILLAAMIGAIVLTLRPHPGLRRQNVAAQTDPERTKSLRHTNPGRGEGI